MRFWMKGSDKTLMITARAPRATKRLCDNNVSIVFIKAMGDTKFNRHHDNTDNGPVLMRS
jgi:hypothetical protein